MPSGNVRSNTQKNVQIVVLDSPEMYPEYAPYTYIDDMKIYIDRVAELEAVS